MYVNVPIATLPVPLGVNVIFPLASVLMMVLPFILILSTVKVVKVPKDVIFPWVAWVVAVSGAKPVMVATVSA